MLNNKDINYDTIRLKKLYDILQTDRNYGLSAEDVEKRLEIIGYNEIVGEPRIRLWKLFALQFKNTVLLMLVASSIVAMALQEFVEGSAILLIIIINVCISVYTERSSSNALDALMSLSQPTCKVKRNGNIITIPSREVVPGDIMILSSGDVIAADARIIIGHDVKVNEMILTGESKEVSKTAYDNNNQINDENNNKTSDTLTPSTMVFSSTNITSGNAIAIVVNTGMNTRVGDIAKLLQTSSANKLIKENTSSGAAAKEASQQLAIKKRKRTPMQRNIHRLGLTMGLFAIICSALVFLTGMLRNESDPTNANPLWLSMLLIAITLAVSGIPESLPLVVTICLTMGAKRLAKSNVLVRELPVVEALGSITVIATDKTGTLTQGKMTAVRLYTSQQEYTITGKGFTPIGDILLNGKSIKGQTDYAVETTLLVGVLCSDATITYNTSKDEWDGLGSATEIPIIVTAKKMNIEKSIEIDKKYPRIDQIPFASTRKMMITIHALADTSKYHNNNMEEPLSQSVINDKKNIDKQEEKPFISDKNINDPVTRPPKLGSLCLPAWATSVVCMKGAPHAILSYCSSMILSSGEVIALNDTYRNEIIDSIDGLSEQALRVMAIAFKPMETIPYKVENSKNGHDTNYDKTKTDNHGEVNMTQELKQSSLSSSLDGDAKIRLFTRTPNFVFCGLLGVFDPERDGVKESIAVCRRAGIRVIMITGDYLKTAVAIAKNLQLLDLGADINVEAVDCTQALRPPPAENGKYNGNKSSQYLNPLAIDEITSRTTIFARAKPEDKLIIVQSLQRQNHLCAMTGDGVNDSPALRQANVGICMGTGSAVAKAASKLILLDDDFSSIVKAIMSGRAIFANIQKFVMYFFGTNASQIIIVFLSVLIGLPSPLRAIQILFQNLITDGLPALALTLQKDEEGIMNEPPKPRKEPIIKGSRMVMIILHIVGLTIALIVVYFTGLYWHTGSLTIANLYPDNTPFNAIVCKRMDSHGNWQSITGGDCVEDGVIKARTMTFITLVFSEILRVWSVRHFLHDIFYDLFGNPFLILATCLSITSVLLVTLVSPLQPIFHTSNIDYHAWLLCVGASLFTLSIDETVKYNYRVWFFSESKWQGMKEGFQEVINEIRSVRLYVKTLQMNLSKEMMMTMTNNTYPSAAPPSSSSSAPPSNSQNRYPFPLPYQYQQTQLQQHQQPQPQQQLSVPTSKNRDFDISSDNLHLCWNGSDSVKPESMMTHQIHKQVEPM